MASANAYLEEISCRLADCNSTCASAFSSIDSAGKGLFYDLEFKQEGPNMDVVCAPDGTILQIENQND